MLTTYLIASAVWLSLMTLGGIYSKPDRANVVGAVVHGSLAALAWACVFA